MGMIEEAVRCVHRGWWVIPCGTRAKHPITQHGAKGASNEEAVVREWWRKHPDANIGVACGPSGLLVIDVDQPDGPEVWRRLCAEEHLTVETVASLTPTGGRHEFFAAPPGLAARNSAGRLGRNLDVRTAGGYVIVPPSAHPAGGTYCWAPGQGPDEHALAPLPEPLARRLAALDGAGGGQGAPVAGPARARGPVRDLRRYAQAALREECDAVRQAPAGTRNDRLNRAAFSLGRLVAHRGLTDGEVEEELAYAATGAGLDAASIAATIRSGLQSGIAIGRRMELRVEPGTVSPARQSGREPARQTKPGAPAGQADDGAGAAPPAPVDGQAAPAAPPAGPSPNDFNLTDAGNGELIAALYRDRLRYDHDSGEWLLWDGARWGPDRKSVVRCLAVEAARLRRQAAVDIPDPVQATRAERWSLGSENGIRVKAALVHASGLAPVAIVHSELNADPWLLGCPNGVVDLRHGTLRPSRPDDLITFSTGTVFDPQAPAPRWERFLQEICPEDPELVAFLGRAAGYSLTGITREQVFFICLGDGANGKSTFLNMLHAVFGDYVGHATAACFERQPIGSTSTNDLAMLAGKRLVTAGETEENRALHEQRVKQMTGEDPITARFLYHENFTFVAHFKLWMATNHRPRITGTDNGIWRRVREIPFRASFQGREDLNLNATLRQELPGILAWAVRGCLEWQRTGLGFPVAVADAGRAYRTEADPLRRFLSECVIPKPGAEVLASSLYERYQSWCVGEHITPDSRTRFGTAMPRLGLSKTKTRLGIAYLDIELVCEGCEGCEGLSIL